MGDGGADAKRDLLAAADRCVACGLCLPHCPSYRVARVEGESPRGRISLIRGWAAGTLAADVSLQTHLDQCLGCLNCQTACPAEVDYQALLTGVRAQLPPTGHGPSRLARWVVAERWRLWLANGLLRLATRFGAANWPWPATWRARLAGLPERPPARLRPAPERSSWLFGGCLSAPLDDAARVAAAQLLARLGQPVHDAADGGCCGLLAQMAGDGVTATRLGESLVERLHDHGVDQLISVSSGCHGRLRELLRAERIELTDLASALDKGLTSKPMAFAGPAVHVVMYEPCSQRAHIGGGTWSRLLQRIPGLSLVRLDQVPTCCGAAGAHHLQHPAQSGALRDELVAAVKASEAQWLLVSNGGCAQYLRAGLRGSGVRVAHPVELLAERALGPLDPNRAAQRLRDRR